jgi:hypothetical protein
MHKERDRLRDESVQMRGTYFLKSIGGTCQEEKRKRVSEALTR